MNDYIYGQGPYFPEGPQEPLPAAVYLVAGIIGTLVILGLLVIVMGGFGGS